ncbi:MAG: flippase [Cytophagales bacterium]
MTKVKSNYIFNLLSTVINLLFPILSFPYASRILGPEGIGKVQFTITFGQYFALFAALGIPIYGIREIAKVKNNKSELSRKFTELSIIYFISSIVLTIIYYTTILSFEKFKQDLNLFTIAGSIVLLSFSSIDWFYNGIEEFGFITIRNILIKLIALISMFYFVVNKTDVLSYHWIMVFVITGNNILNFIFVWKKVDFNSEKLNFKVHFKPLILVFSTTLASSMYTLFDVLILGFLTNDRSVGLYTAGVKLCKVTIPLVTSLGTVLMPQVALYHSQKDSVNFNNVLTKSYNFLVFISFPVATGLCFLSKEFILIFSGSEYLEANLSMKILSLLPILIGFGFLFGLQILIATGKDKEMFISVSMGMISGILFNLILIPIWDYNGASLANIISEAFVSLTYFYFVSKGFNIQLKFKPLRNALISCLLMIPTIEFIKFIFENNAVLILLISIPFSATIYFLVQYVIFKSEIIADLLNFGKTKLSKLYNK